MKLHLSYFDKKTSVALQNEMVDVKAFQVIVWVSVTPDEFSPWDTRTPKFPAILDIGNNHNLALSEGHLSKWAGISPSALLELKKIREKGIQVPLHEAGLWLHADGGPFRLEVDEGIAVYESAGPRLPTLGLRALTNNRLQTFIYGDTRQVVLRTPPKWYWPF